MCRISCFSTFLRMLNAGRCYKVLHNQPDFNNEE
jgi:hypothetical protein